MRVLIVASDEPVYLGPYLRRVIDECREMIVGVAVHAPDSRRSNLRKWPALALLAALMMSRRQWWQLVVWKCADAIAITGLLRTRHHLADICRDAGVPVQRISSVNADSFVAFVRDQHIDVLFHQTPEILRPPVLRAPSIAVLNRHMSLLPSYRGAWPIFWQLANGEKVVGITLHIVDEGVDSGAIVVQEALTRRKGETMAALLARLFDRAAPLTRVAFERLRLGAAAAAAVDGRRAGNVVEPSAVYKTPTAREVMRYMLTPHGLSRE